MKKEIISEAAERTGEESLWRQQNKDRQGTSRELIILALLVHCNVKKWHDNNIMALSRAAAVNGLVYKN